MVQREHGRAYVDGKHRLRAWAQRQAVLDFAPPAAPLPPVQDQMVPSRERLKLCRMNRVILERLRHGSATASALQAMFPGARSVRTRISDVSLWLQRHERQRVASEPVRGAVGEWVYWIEDVR